MLNSFSLTTFDAVNHRILLSTMSSSALSWFEPGMSWQGRLSAPRQPSTGLGAGASVRWQQITLFLVVFSLLLHQRHNLKVVSALLSKNTTFSKQNRAVWPLRYGRNGAEPRSCPLIGRDILLWFGEQVWSQQFMYISLYKFIGNSFRPELKQL